ncbi:MAG: 1-deoxy-D-xylulose-5-phosphate synthase, partial [Acidobacteria bacterium]|nr:1-deoxy-D-xylulose-5-phosphate synthase [Acidobacteriota bacterium]
YNESPFAIRYPKSVAEPYNENVEPVQLKIGSWEVVSQGKDIAIIAVGPMVNVAVECSKILEKNEISAEVINARFLKPLDESYLKNRINSFSLVVSIEENSAIGGFGAYLDLCLHNLNIKVNRLTIGIPDKFITHGKREILLEEVGLSARKIAEKILASVKQKNYKIIEIK